MQTLTVLRIKGLNHQTPHPIWPVSRVVTGKKIGNNKEPYLFMNLRGGIIIKALSELDFIPTP